MGERKGQNKYYPPDYDPKSGGLNKWQGVHALRERGRKSHLGIIIIRFEMPYNIWCLGCNNHIGMGVRYNAEKKKVGMYYTTPVYEFNMKCHLCDNHFIIKTDPGNLDYEILSGARRQENRWDPLENSQVVPETKETQKRLFDDPMYKLEHGSNDLEAGSSGGPRLARLFQRNEDTWSDTYTLNQTLRKYFRQKNKDLKVRAATDRDLLRKSSLDIPLVSETDEDKHMAKVLSRKIKPNKTTSGINVNKRLIMSTSLNVAQQRRAKRLVHTNSSPNELLVKSKAPKDSTKPQRRKERSPSPSPSARAAGLNISLVNYSSHSSSTDSN